MDNWICGAVSRHTTTPINHTKLRECFSSWSQVNILVLDMQHFSLLLHRKYSKFDAVQKIKKNHIGLDIPVSI